MIIMYNPSNQRDKNDEQMKRILVFLSIGLSLCSLSAQVAPGKFFIEFRNKGGNPYTLDKPGEFLSEQAMLRRQNQWIGYDSTDLPVTPSYIAGVQKFVLKVSAVTKWLNGIIVDLSDTTLIDSILSLPYVQAVGRQAGPQRESPQFTEKFSLESVSNKEILDQGIFAIDNEAPGGYNYGASYTQIHMVKGDLLHLQGFRGKGKVIAILDAGFQNADVLNVFDSLRTNGRILGARDFVNPGNDVYREHPHGMEVLSIIGGNIPGKLIGTAPEASFWLYRTEDTGSEYIVEEYYWIAAAEVADSAGADIITSSLGYTTFSDPRQDHTCAEMNGYTTPVARGANLAARKGIIVTCSAGNSGGTSWKCMSSPADALGAMGIGAVDSLGHYAGFSSVGVSTSRIKPNVVAQGEKTVLAASDGAIIRGNGTSFATPIIAGMMACLAQAVPAASNYELIRATELSASQVSNPDSLLGYGLPDFSKAIGLVGIGEITRSSESTRVVPNPFEVDFTLVIYSKRAGRCSLSVLDLSGRQITTPFGFQVKEGENRIPAGGNQFKNLTPGFYFLRVTGEGQTTTTPLIKTVR
jgi:subtilisin family serine protease